MTPSAQQQQRCLQVSIPSSAACAHTLLCWCAPSCAEASVCVTTPWTWPGISSEIFFFFPADSSCLVWLCLLVCSSINSLMQLGARPQQQGPGTPQRQGPGSCFCAQALSEGTARHGVAWHSMAQHRCSCTPWSPRQCCKHAADVSVRLALVSTLTWTLASDRLEITVSLYAGECLSFTQVEGDYLRNR